MQVKAKALYVAPLGRRVGLTTVCLGLVRALDRVGIRVGFCKPIAQLAEGDTGPERSTHLIRNTTDLNPPEPLDFDQAQVMAGSGKTDDLMDQVMAMFDQAASGADVVIVEGLIPTGKAEQTVSINRQIVSALDASVILVGAPGPGGLDELGEDFRTVAAYYGGVGDSRLLGAIVNFVNAPAETLGASRADPDTGPADAETITMEQIETRCDVFREDSFRLLGCIPWHPAMVSPRTADIVRHLGAVVINRGEIEQRRVGEISLCARSLENITHVFKPNALLLIPADRADLLVSACMAALNGVRLAGLVLTCGIEVKPGVLELCRKAFKTGLPVIAVPGNSYKIAIAISRMNVEVPIDDRERIELTMDYTASQIDGNWLRDRCAVPRRPRLSPAAFRHQLVELAREANRRIVLPEGTEPRTLQAASICQNRGIAQCVLLGKDKRIRRIAEQSGITLAPGLEIVNPADIREQFVARMVELRQHKGLTPAIALSQLEDEVQVGTMMLERGDVHGLVAGAEHTTAQVVRPALQFIGCSPGAKLVSSVFFMCLPDNVVVYGDCAVNPDPNAEELADIAIQSADSAASFGIEPRVAMISYSTGESGTGADVEKVKEATRIVRTRRPDLAVDGPLQYDAATSESVARSKAPNSPVAGRATVFVFPDLNTGNTTYKAVQRSANVISIGPMLQGLRKPVNDLSRGALVDDIVYTIAITAIQAAQSGAPTPA